MRQRAVAARLKHMEPVGIHHVSLNVSDVPAGVQFYLDVLGGTARDDRPAFSFDGAWIDFGDQQVHLIEAAVPENLGQHFALRVRDLDAAVRELRAKVVAVSDPVAVGSGRQAFVNDPFGNTIELHEVGAGA